MARFLATAALGILFGMLCSWQADALAPFQEDVFPTSAGEVRIAFLGHGTLMFSFSGKVIHVDPYGKVADYATLPKADGVLITHEHQDHLDMDALTKILKDDTEIILNEKSFEVMQRGKVLRNGDSALVAGVKVEAVPAYNILHKRDNGQPFHPKGLHNGYILTFGDTRFYIAGDTENTPEMKELRDIAVAFLPMNLPYTMTPEMAADAALAFRPKILYPYHFGQTDPWKLADLLKSSGIEVRIRNLS